MRGYTTGFLMFGGYAVIAVVSHFFVSRNFIDKRMLRKDSCKDICIWHIYKLKVKKIECLDDACRCRDVVILNAANKISDEIARISDTMRSDLIGWLRSQEFKNNYAGC
jgi:hypothetical protein